MRTLNDYFITAEIEDISTASSTFVAIPDGGRVVKILTALQGAISGDDSAITLEYDGSAAGDVDSSEPSAANNVDEGGTIEMITDGGSTGTAKLLVTFVIRR